MWIMQMSVQTIEKHTCEECCLGNNNNRLATNSKLAKITLRALPRNKTSVVG
jgi:hypothetical protein